MDIKFQGIKLKKFALVISKPLTQWFMILIYKHEGTVGRACVTS